MPKGKPSNYIRSINLQYFIVAKTAGEIVEEMQT